MDIKIKHLGKAYGEQQILKDFSCLFPEGKTTCIRGKSGCGKTTLLRLLLGLESPDTGEIEGMEGKKIAAVFQEDRLCENLSAAPIYEWCVGNRLQTSNWRRPIKPWHSLISGRSLSAN